jgi:hypothetical protein
VSDEVGRDFAARMRRAEEIVGELDRRGGEAADASRELLRAVLDVHEAGLARVLAIANAEGEAGRKLLRALAADVDVASLLLLHGLHPEPLEARVRAALDDLGPSLVRGGARIEAIEITGAVVRVVVARGSHGAPAKSVVEETLLAAAPDADAIDVEEIVAGALVPAERLARRVDEGSP